MNLKQLFLTENECYKVGQKITVKGIMVHSTGANNPWLKRYVGPDDGHLGKNQYGNHWNALHPGGKNVGSHAYVNKNGDGKCDVCGGRQVCVHGFIGKLADGSIATYQTLPWDARGWHAGKATGNDAYISFEICEDNLTDAAYLKKVYKEAAELCAYLCKEFGLDPAKDGVIICHSEGHKRGIASNHGDVMHWWPKHGLNMDMFRAEVKKLVGNAASTPSNGPTEAHTLYRVQTGAFSKKANADALAAELKAKGYETYIVKAGNFYKVQCGAFAEKKNAINLASKLKAAGYDTFVTTAGGGAV